VWMRPASWPPGSAPVRGLRPHLAGARPPADRRQELRPGEL